LMMNLLKNLPDNPLEGAKAICDSFITKHYMTYQKNPTEEYYEAYLEAYAIMLSYIGANHLNIYSRINN
jgi:hypothetical protein